MAFPPRSTAALARTIDRVIAGLFVGTLAWVTWHLGGAMGQSMGWGFAVAMLARNDPKLAKKLAAFRKKQTVAVRAMKLPVKK